MTDEAEVLRRFLTADPRVWPQLAPEVVRRVGEDRLRAIVAATGERVGGISGVADAPDGLLVTGPAGAVLAWARVRDGRLTGLLVDGRRYRPRRRPWSRPAVLRGVAGAGLACWVVSCWQAGSVAGAAGRLLALLAGLVLFEGFGAPGALPRWWRRLVEAEFLVAFAAVGRVPGLPAGAAWRVVPGALLLGAVGVLLVRGRRFRWGSAARLTAFPLRGTWYVVQGGGRGLNHHRRVPEQRGAVDLVRPGGAGGRRLTDHPSYGAPVTAPCDGRIVTAVDGLPDQVPGVIRYGPPFGNHVVIDRAGIRVVLAHLRPGSVRVVPGQQVRAGEQVGLVGNSGNSTEPHLHLHLHDGRGLDLDVAGISGTLHRGRRISSA
ncbi:putative metalloprotease [Actinoplanes sp. SE50]|uniref:M23 family metallopeptidase n=1 Tax=unclassified Actinoplanes TaxID=2626549 RepID=UPI00023ED61E|nr:MULTISPECIES: M23 family metallopeptidase [unclassified Actinoplanes]AEV85034.1 putative metalloprotease [Actinoplanes sp. SE50/110]ATO83425.1 putative metalloprotease [Actinoplanes sp. SE50]SLM00832.1 putative metalloprotease [Actinoplanes sp. SE50/110]